MRTRKHLWGLLTMLMVAMLSVSLTACGGDDDDDDNVGNSSLVGVWVERHSSYSVGIRLDANGKAYYNEWNGIPNLDQWDDELSISWSATDNVIYFRETENGETWNEQTHYSLSDDGKTLSLSRQDGDPEGNNYLPNGTFTKSR